VTSWPRSTRPRVSRSIAISVPPCERGGTEKQIDAICAILTGRSGWPTQEAPPSPSPSRPDGARGLGWGASLTESKWKRYLATVKGTTAAVFSQAIASLPPASDMSTKPIENWSIETAGVIIAIGTRTTSNFGS
jgi:hypothetical protein